MLTSSHYRRLSDAFLWSRSEVLKHCRLDVLVPKGLKIYELHGDGSKPCTPSVHIKIAGLKWMFIPLKIVFS